VKLSGEFLLEMIEESYRGGIVDLLRLSHWAILLCKCVWGIMVISFGSLCVAVIAESWRIPEMVDDAQL
jgi:hypothetical protein